MEHPLCDFNFFGLIKEEIRGKHLDNKEGVESKVKMCVNKKRLCRKIKHFWFFDYCENKRGGKFWFMFDASSYQIHLDI